jgi:FkbM family methyltransferase
MLIPFNELKEYMPVPAIGIIHAGASHGEELDAYLNNNIKNIIWIEAIPEIFEKLRENVKRHAGSRCFCRCLSDKVGQYVKFNITNNDGQSSSMLELGTHKQMHPDVYVTDTIMVTTDTLSNIIYKENINIGEYDFLNMDLQGSELTVLRGFESYLPFMKYIYLEVNEQELYQNCALLPEIDEYLLKFGFYRKILKMTDAHWGDAFYVKHKNEALYA